VYLALAVVGVIAPYAFFLQWFGSGDVGFRAFLEQMFATPVAGGLSADLTMSSIVFWVWSWGEARRRGMRRWWLYVVANLAVGLSLALPLFLWAREGASETG
jgi:hypothetical protein